MKIGFFSDLHLDFYQIADRNYLIDKLADEGSCVDVLVNAGDTHHTAADRDAISERFAAANPKYIEVLGNHDYYRSLFLDTVSRFHPADSTETFMHGTMWTDFRRRDPDVVYAATRCVRDFIEIGVPEVKGIPKQSLAALMADAHDYFIHDLIEFRPSVVVSHFAPALGSVHPRFSGQILNGYFVNDDEEHILRAEPKLWIHGHCHDPADYMVGNTRVVSHPLGYPRKTYDSVRDYSLKVIEI